MIINSNDSPQANSQWWVKCSVSPSGEREFFASSSLRLYPGFSALCDGILMPSVRLECASVPFYALTVRALLL